MAKPTGDKRRLSDQKRAIVLNRINRAGAPKRAIPPSISREQFHTILDKASQPIKHEVESDS